MLRWFPKMITCQRGLPPIATVHKSIQERCSKRSFSKVAPCVDFFHCLRSSGVSVSGSLHAYFLAFLPLIFHDYWSRSWIVLLLLYLTATVPDVSFNRSVWIARSCYVWNVRINYLLSKISCSSDITADFIFDRESFFRHFSFTRISWSSPRMSWTCSRSFITRFIMILISRWARAFGRLPRLKSNLRVGTAVHMTDDWIFFFQYFDNYKIAKLPGWWTAIRKTGRMVIPRWSESTATDSNSIYWLYNYWKLIFYRTWKNLKSRNWSVEMSVAKTFLLFVIYLAFQTSIFERFDKLSKSYNIWSI